MYSILIKDNSKSYFLCDEEEWYREEVPFDAYLDIDGKSVSVLKDTLRSIWNNAETLGGKTCYVFNAEITGNDYVQLLDFYMTGMNKEDEWNQFVEYFQQNNKRTSMESFLENCYASLVGYVDKATGKLKVVDVSIDYIPVNEALYSIDILPEDNQIISNVTENDYVINSMFFSISFLNDQESIEIPEGINFEQ